MKSKKMKPDLKNLIKAGAVVQEAIKSLELELNKAYKGRTVYLPKNTVPHSPDAQGPCLVDHVALFGNDNYDNKFKWLEITAVFFPEDDGSADCDDAIIHVELQYLDRLKFLV